MLADKITQLRKKNGWSQEELANRMEISRQAVSKWESNQATPDIEKIIQLSSLFGVTIDSLLKEDGEHTPETCSQSQSASVQQDKVKTPSSLKPAIQITWEETQNFLELQREFSWKIALGVFLCIFSPIPLIILCGIAGSSIGSISETTVVTIGLVVLFAFVIGAVTIFLYCGFKGEPFQFLEKNIPFELESTARHFVLEQKKQQRSGYIKWNIIAICICIFSPIPVLLSLFGSELLRVIMVTVTMVIAGIGVAIFIVVNIRNEALQKLLKEGDYTEKAKMQNELKGPIMGAYWCILVAIYLFWSFTADSWKISWIVFVAGGILSSLVEGLCIFISNKRQG